MTDFQYDVAVSSVEYDDLTVKELARRLDEGDPQSR